MTTYMKRIAFITLLLNGVPTAMGWTRQSLLDNSNGLHKGVAVIDINEDDANDLIFCGGTQTGQVEQPYVLINRGYQNNGIFEFSDPIPIGLPGAYSQCDIAWLPGIDSYGLLLSSSSTNQETVLLGIDLSEECGFWTDVQCSLEWSEIWASTNSQSMGEGAFLDLGDGSAPSIVLASKTQAAVFEFGGSGYPTAATFTLSFNGDDSGSALAVGTIAGQPGFVVGSKFGPFGELIAVYRADSGVYSQVGIDSTIVPVRARMADIDGDGVDDVVAANFEQAPAKQSYFLFDDSLGNIRENELFEASSGIAAVGLGLLYEESQLPDFVFADDNGSLTIFRNQGTDAESSQFLGFVQQPTDDTLTVPADCSIQDLQVVELWPCTVTIVVATECSASLGNQAFTADTCDIMEWLQEMAPTEQSPAFISPAAPVWNMDIFSPAMSPVQIYDIARTELQQQAQTDSPTFGPTVAPVSAWPSDVPSGVPTEGPSTTLRPTSKPTVTSSPTSISGSPSITPTVSSPPTLTKSQAPTGSANPSTTPSSPPSRFPTVSPTYPPSNVPTVQPTNKPTPSPIEAPSNKPSTSPSMHPTPSPSFVPSDAPSLVPSQTPTLRPTTLRPSASPSVSPTTDTPSFLPSSSPSAEPSITASAKPSMSPTGAPSQNPSSLPSPGPSTGPTLEPTRNDESAFYINGEWIDPATNSSSGPLMGGWQVILVIVAGTMVAVLLIGFKFSRYEENKRKNAIAKAAAASSGAIELELVYDNDEVTCDSSVNSRPPNRLGRHHKKRSPKTKSSWSTWSWAPSVNGEQTDASSTDLSVYVTDVSNADSGGDEHSISSSSNGSAGSKENGRHTSGPFH